MAVCLFVWSEDWIWSRAEARAAARILWEASLFSWFFGGIGGSARRVFGRLRVRIRVGLGLFRQWPVVGSPPSLSFLFGDSNYPNRLNRDQHLSILFKAMTNGVPRPLSMFRLLIVCCSRPCMKNCFKTPPAKRNAYAGGPFLHLARMSFVV